MVRDHPEVYAPRWAWLTAGGFVALSLVSAVTRLDSPTRIELVEEFVPFALFAWLFVMCVGYCYRLRWNREVKPLTEWEDRR
jgi:hypothetical protein